jgi:hypothetical protein
MLAFFVGRGDMSSSSALRLVTVGFALFAGAALADAFLVVTDLVAVAFIVASFSLVTLVAVDFFTALRASFAGRDDESSSAIFRLVLGADVAEVCEFFTLSVEAVALRTGAGGDPETAFAVVFTLVDALVAVSAVLAVLAVLVAFLGGMLSETTGLENVVEVFSESLSVDIFTPI